MADDSAIARANRKAGRFILATNAIDHPTMTAEQVLSDSSDLLTNLRNVRIF